MNLEFFKENRIYLQILLGGLLVIGLLLAAYALTTREQPDAAQLERNANNTRTAVALTSQALLGPFPTSTAPSATASDTPAPAFTLTPTPSPTRTRTATPFVFTTFTARIISTRATITNTPRPTRTWTPVPPQPTNTRLPPTNPPPTTPPPTTYP